MNKDNKTRCKNNDYCIYGKYRVDYELLKYLAIKNKEINLHNRKSQKKNQKNIIFRIFRQYKICRAD